ncbi:MAG: hypothetical protein IKA76_06390 [Clostridia bacterium]|nr:hypothetical protein [Clostridia bacterium]
MNMKQWGNRLLILCLALWILLGGFLLLLPPYESFSHRENRTLAQAPALRADTIWSGTFSKDVQKFCADQFPLRSFFVSLSAYSELAFGKGERNGILFAREGFLIPRGEHTDFSVLTQNLNAIRSFREISPVPVSTLLIPRHIDALAHLLPSGYSTERAALIPNTVLHHSKSLLFPIKEWQGKSDYYYKTDHHLTTEGAYAAYRLLGESLGYPPKEESYFEPVTVSQSFLGTSYSSAGGISFAKDSVTLYRYLNDDRFTVSVNSAEPSLKGFYREEFLKMKDHYSIFLGGNYAHLTVTDPLEKKPHLLLIKDSFANALIPFLAIHFDLTVYDLRYRSDVSFGDLSDYDHVLIVQGLETLATDSSLRNLPTALLTK